MNIKSFENLARTENTARRFLASLCWKNYRRFCIRCNSYQIYRIAGKRFRCKRCKYTFHDFTGRWLNKLRISCQDWLWIIKFFELELSARKITQQIDLSYPTVLKAITLIRKAIVANSADASDLFSGGNPTSLRWLSRPGPSISRGRVYYGRRPASDTDRRRMH